MSNRIHHWGTSLAALVAARIEAPFEWGRHDCALWAADCVFAITAHDPAADLRGTYSTAAGAVAVVQRLGGLGAIASARLGEEIAPALAQIGDVVLCQLRGRDTLCVEMGTHLSGPGEAGLVAVHKREALRAWRCTRAD